MSHSSWILVDFVVVAALVGLVAEEVDGGVFDTTWQVLLVLDMLQTVGLVPALGEDIEGDLAADGVAVVRVSCVELTLGGSYVVDSRQTKIWEFLLQTLDECLSDSMFQIKLLIIISLLHACVPADWAHIDHAIAELDESTSLDWNIQVCDVVQNVSDELLVLFLTNPLDEAVRGEGLAHAVGGQAILCEAEVEERGDWDRGRAELFLLFGEIRAADEADCYFVTEGGEELEHLWGYSLLSRKLACPSGAAV